MSVLRTWSRSHGAVRLCRDSVGVLLRLRKTAAMNFDSRFRLWRRRKWDRVDATLVGARFVARKLRSGGSSGSYEIREYMVDVPGQNGEPPARLTFEEKSFRVRDYPERGDIVPVIVNAERTKTMFDLSDERIDEHGWVQASVQRSKKEGDERFEARRKGASPAPRAPGSDDEADD